jgi:hypothetical protein
MISLPSPRARAAPACAVVLAVAVLAACGAGGGSAGGSTATGPESSTPTSTNTSINGTSATPTEPATVPEVEVTLLGVVVGGSGGGVGQGQTDSLSEVVREEDGSCAGWASPGAGGSWTSGAREGGVVKVYDAAQGGHLLATGRLGPGKAENVDPQNDQWQCALAFGVEKVKRSAKYFVRVDSLARVEARVGPGGGLVVPFGARVAASMIDSCRAPSAPAPQAPTAPASSGPAPSSPDTAGPGPSGSDATTAPDPTGAADPTGAPDPTGGSGVGDWQSFGTYWSQGLASVCGAGLRVERIERVCRPANLATGRVVAVVDAGTGIVLEDASGLHLEGQHLTEGAPVVVRVSTAYPC